MSRQSEAKERQGYDPKPLARSCRLCSNLKPKIKELLDWQGRPYNNENLFCGLGGFAVKAQAVCREFKGKEG
jgi:hypothetical protein